MFGFLRKKPKAHVPEPDISAAARQLATAPRHPRKISKAKAAERRMTNRLRADLRAKGKTHLHPIDWSTFE